MTDRQKLALLNSIWDSLSDLDPADANEIVMLLVDRFVAEIDLEGENGMTAREFMIHWLQHAGEFRQEEFRQEQEKAN